MVTRLWQHLTGVADNSSSDDDVPLATLITKPHNDSTPLHEATNSSTMDSNNNSGTHKHDGSSDDDVPLIKLKDKQEKPVEKTTTPERRSPVLEMEDSDDEPLINKTNKSSLAQSAECNEKILDCTKNLIKEDGSGEEPLMRVTKLTSKTVEKTETFSKDQKDETTASDDEPLINTTNTSSTQRTEGNGKNPDCTENKTDDSSDDDVPLTKLKCKQEKPVRMNSVKAKTSPALAGIKDTSDEPLIKKTKTSSLAQTAESNGKTLDGTNGTENKSTDGSSDDDDDDVPLIKLKCKQRRPVLAAIEDPSDDEPLIKKTKTFSPAQETASSGRKMDCTQNKSTDGSSDDDVPLTKLKCKQEKPVRKTSIPVKRSPVLDDSSEDEPLSSLLAKKSSANDIKKKSSNSRIKRRADLTKKNEDRSDEENMAVTKVKKPTTLKRGQKERPKAQRRSPHVASQKTTYRKKSKDIPHKQKYCDSSDDEPLMKKKTTKALSKERTPMGNKRRSKTKVPVCSEGSSDDVPLAKLICKQQKPVPARSTTVLESSKVHHHSDLNKDVGELSLVLSTDSDDEPLINIRKRTAKPLEMTTGTVLKVILERCGAAPQSLRV